MNKEKRAAAYDVLKGTVNILFAALTGAIAFTFAAYGYNYKSLPFISEYYAFLMGVTAGAIGVMFIAFIIFYLLKKQSFYRFILCAFIFLDIIAVGFYVLCYTGVITKIDSGEDLQEFIASFGGWAEFLYIVFSFLQVVILPVPGSVTVAAGVLLFGPFWSAVYSFIGIVLGSIVAFAIGRVIGYKAVCWIVGKDDVDKWLNKVKGKDYLILSLMFLLPMFPDDVLCFVSGLSSMSWSYYIVMIVITRIISVFTTAYALDIIPFTTWWGILIWIIIFALVVLVFWLILKYSDKIDAYIKKKFKFGISRK